MQTPSPAKALIAALATTLLLSACNKPQLVANFPNFNAAAEQCLNDLETWREQELKNQGGLSWS